MVPTPRKPRVLIVVGYFDWFSGYQETALAAAFSRVAHTEVVTSDRVNPAFSDGHLSTLGIERRYERGSRNERSVIVTRFGTAELRSMVWSNSVRRYIGSQYYDLVIQMMPGQGLPIAASFAPRPPRRIVLYGDNHAMWAQLSPLKRWLKGLAFTLSKGVAYAVVNARADALYGYTDSTVHRLRPFRAGRSMEVMPLGYAADRFYFDSRIRSEYRANLGYREEETVVLAAGKYHSRKRLDWLVRAFENLAPSRGNLRLLFVGLGGTHQSRSFEESLARSDAAHHIKTVGFVDGAELNAAFNAADLAVWPRSPAITIQQAMGTGLPVVLPRNDLVGHLLKSRSDAGVYFDPVENGGSCTITATLEYAVDHFDRSDSARRHRVEMNSWLSADTLARGMLETAVRLSPARRP